MLIRICTGLLLAVVSTFVPENRPPLGAAVAFRCAVGEPLDLRNPVVTVVQGAGDPNEQRAWWEGLQRAWVAGDVAIFIGEESFVLEVAP